MDPSGPPPSDAAAPHPLSPGAVAAPSAPAPSAPIAVPVAAPVAAPVDAPVDAPVAAPVAAPVDAPVDAPVTPAWSGISGRVAVAWRLQALFGLAILAVPAAAVLVPAMASGALPWRATLAVGGALALAVLALALLWPGLAWRRWAWRLDADVLEVRSGVWTRTSQLVPLSRLQHVDLKAGLLERALGLATLVVHTAGTHDAAIGLPGLPEDEAAALRDRLAALGAGGDDGV